MTSQQKNEKNALVRDIGGWLAAEMTRREAHGLDSLGPEDIVRLVLARAGL